MEAKRESLAGAAGTGAAWYVAWSPVYRFTGGLVCYKSNQVLMTAQPKPAGASPGKTAIAIVLVCALILISGFIYSPWHRHNPASRQACVFSPVEACWTLEAGSPVQVPPVLSVVWITCVRAARLPLARLSRPRFGRAPPA